MRTILLAACIILGVCAASAPKHELKIYPCPPGIPSTAHCVTLHVFEDRAAAGGRRIDIALVILPALARNTSAIFPIAGGPGQSTIEFISYYLATGLKTVRAHHDIVFVDQRGTGASHPLQCPSLYADQRTTMEELIPLAQVLKCRKALSATANLAMYGTDAAADDLDDIRAALAYEKIELYGSSYGTAVAQVYARRHPEHVRALLLEGVDTLDSKSPLPFAAGAQHALENVFSTCAAQAACDRAFPELRSHFNALFARFEAGPLTVSARNLKDHTSTQYKLSKAVFADRLRQMLYSPQGATIVPLIIERAYTGDSQPLATAIVFMTGQLRSGIAQGQWLSVTCSESIAFITEADIAAASGNSFLGDLRVRAQQAACKTWNIPAAPASFIEPVRSNAPTLMISASDDPATPQSLAKAQLKYMPNAREVVIPGGGHDNSGACVYSIIGTFLDSGDPKTVHAECLRGSARPPFITDEKIFWQLLKDA